MLGQRLFRISDGEQLSFLSFSSPLILRWNLQMRRLCASQAVPLSSPDAQLDITQSPKCTQAAMSQSTALQVRSVLKFP
jgi:hypothetical protein